ncbi:hypothetical protein HELRODRAFT_161359 [Helobdella robusta]|uniref:Spt20-like SEP domain-containing protein n=1 Tax=Helobdella robusta TaxID=6412 RepID=T1ERE1_HELRO|nr:hypothetical protein HELRODRAFT_161359 [Helobdella robusta]ESO02122.1 hypothetical protein HELRODRAFT_161359 [Helobdella robusta]
MCQKDNNDKQSKLRENKNQDFSTQTNILSSFVEQERLNTLIINLYPGNEGYSIMLRTNGGLQEVETTRLAYEDDDILHYIDKETIPPALIDLFDNIEDNIFHSGCIIAEIRDYRHLTDNVFHTNYVLLKPNDHSLVCDVNALVGRSSAKWSYQDRLTLESKLLLKTVDPLCLEASQQVFFITSQTSSQKPALKSSTLKK